MESIYAAMLLYSAGKEITEERVESVLKAAGLTPDPIRVKSLVAALSEINIGEAIKTPLFTGAAQAAAPAPAEKKEEKKKEEKKEEKKKEEESLQGLAALFQP